MTLMRNGKIVAHAKREQNVFTLDLAPPSQAMSAKAMAIREKGRPTQFVSQNKQSRLWHPLLAHVSNARVVRAFNLVDGVDLGPDNKEYGSAKVFIDSDNLDHSEASANENDLPVDKAWDSALLEPVSVPTIPTRTPQSQTQTPPI